MTDPRVDQTIFIEDPNRPGNCFAAAVATVVGKPLSEVPHFIEHGQGMHNGKLKDDEDPDKARWWAMFVGYVAALELWPVALDSLEDALPDELVFVSGLSPRGVKHQVLYKNGQLWHDPHPSRSGVDPIDTGDLFVLRGGFYHDHTPTLEI